MKTLALVMIVKNESRSLEKCLAKAKKLVDEIFITDTGSTDDTVKIAEKFGAHISHFKWKNDFAAARNFALEQSTCDWNLVLDADEYLISGKRREIQEFMEKGEAVGEIQRIDAYLENNGEVSTARTYTPRLMPKETRYVGKIHEQVQTHLPSVKIPLVFEHDGYLQEGKGERNLEILLEELEESPENPYILYQISKTLRNMKRQKEADSYFTYFYKLVPQQARYRAEGVVLYLYNLLDLQKYEEGLALIQREENACAFFADYYFACGVFYTQMILADTKKYVSYLPCIEKSYLKCLEIGEIPENEGVLGTGSFKAAYNLGVWFEVTGDTLKALEYYQKAEKDGYLQASERIKIIKQSFSKK